MTYRRTARQSERLKAIAGVVVVHAALAAVILTGLDVETVTRAVERMQTISIVEQQPPPPPPPPVIQPARAREEVGAAGRRAEPTPVVAPKPAIELPARTPIIAAPVAGSGNAARSGAAVSGTGTGAGGSGLGRGGGGSGDFTGFTPATLVRNLSDGDYRRLAGGRLANGSAMLSLLVDPTGRPTNCKVSRSSGDSGIDAGLCPLITRRLRFRPARDSAGKAIPYSLQYVANWSL